MAKVFRLYNGNNTLVDWQNSVPYGTTAIDQILDPDASTAKKEITSIPSPFARMDLIKNAFAYVNRTKDIHGKTIFHKMVSDTLDVAQIFFQYERFKSKVDIIVWDKSQKLNELKQSSDSALKTVNKQRADLGAYQNRMEMAQKGVDIASENTQAAESRIRDTDMAAEMVDYVKNQILTQSSTAMLANANSQTQNVLALLK